MSVFEIILLVVVIGQFIYLNLKVNKMAKIDELRTAITDLDASVDSIIAKLEDLKTQLGNSVLAADIDAEITRLTAIKAKIDASNQ